MAPHSKKDDAGKRKGTRASAAEINRSRGKTRTDEYKARRARKKALLQKKEERQKLREQGQQLSKQELQKEADEDRELQELADIVMEDAPPETDDTPPDPEQQIERPSTPAGAREDQAGTQDRQIYEIEGEWNAVGLLPPDWESSKQKELKQSEADLQVPSTRDYSKLEHVLKFGRLGENYTIIRIGNETGGTYRVQPYLESDALLHDYQRPVEQKRILPLRDTPKDGRFLYHKDDFVAIIGVIVVPNFLRRGKRKKHTMSDQKHSEHTNSTEEAILKALKPKSQREKEQPEVHLYARCVWKTVSGPTIESRSDIRRVYKHDTENRFKDALQYQEEESYKKFLDTLSNRDEYPLPYELDLVETSKSRVTEAEDKKNETSDSVTPVDQSQKRIAELEKQVKELELAQAKQAVDDV